jgi:signal transduction histidine kinase
MLAVTLPSLVIVALGLRLITQERELAINRADDERRRLVADVRQELVERLARIRAAGTSASLPPDPPRRAGASREREIGASPLLLSIPVRGGQIVPPWEPAAGWARRVKGEQDPAARELDAGDRAEQQHPSEAIEAYRRAAAGRDPVVGAHARFALARALARTGRTAEAEALDRGTAAAPLDGVGMDEFGVPLAIYAAQRIAQRGGALPGEFMAHSRAYVADGGWPSPVACYALREIAGHAARSTDPSVRHWAQEIDAGATQRAAEGERVLNLQREVDMMMPRGVAPDEPRWVATGNPAWLVSLAQVPQDDPRLIVADAARLSASLAAHPGAAQLRLTTSGAGSDALGDPFPGLRLSYTTLDAGGGARARMQRWFYGAALGMVLGVTALGVFLLWRDVRREMRAGALRSQFVASVSHELKTPLTSIRMFAETLRMRPSLEAGAAGEYLDTIVHESERLTRLLNNVLDFSQIEQERKTYRFAPVDLREAISTAARGIAYPLSQEGFTLDMRLDPGVPAVRADQDAIEQAVLNLLTNAMKYSGASRRIGLSLERLGNAAVIAVTDDGPGIPVEEQPRLFERFYRARMPGNQQIPGTGLGLTIVRHIADAHGGAVTVDSAPGRGSTFTISLPIRDASPSAAGEMSGVPL